MLAAIGIDTVMLATAGIIKRIMLVGNKRRLVPALSGTEPLATSWHLILLVWVLVALMQAILSCELLRQEYLVQLQFRYFG